MISGLATVHSDDRDNENWLSSKPRKLEMSNFELPQSRVEIFGTENDATELTLVRKYPCLEPLT